MFNPGCFRSQPLRGMAFRGYAPPNPAVHFWPPKSEPKRRQPLSGWTPAFAQSVSIGGETQLPLKFQMYFVIGALHIRLRLSALESMAVSFLLTRACAFQQMQMVRHRKQMVLSL